MTEQAIAHAREMLGGTKCEPQNFEQGITNVEGNEVICWEEKE